MKPRARGAVAASAAACLLLAACGAFGGSGRPEQHDPDLRIWAPPIVRWAPGADRALRFMLENTTYRTLPVREPDPAWARVAIFAGAGSAGRACGVDPAPPAPADTVSLAPGDQIPVRVDLGKACADLVPGEYRYELTYELPRARSGSVKLPTQYGIIVVEAPTRAPAPAASEDRDR